MSDSPRKVMIVGLGAAGSVHVKTLEDFPAITVVSGIDTDPSRSITFREKQVPVHGSVFDAMSSRVKPDVIVVATPTPSHAQICGEIADHFPEATIIVEKPAADSLDDVRRMIGDGGKQPVSVAYHMAFSPEVDWALSQVGSWGDLLDSPVTIESWFTDPYRAGLDAAKATLVDSWIDSGINALSVIERFTRVERCTSLRRIGHADNSVFEGSFLCAADGRQIPAVVLTSWHSTAPARTTRIRYSSGAELVMDHNAVAGYLRVNGITVEMFGTDGVVPRREAHYKALYASWLGNQEIFPRKASLRLHELLLQNHGSPDNEERNQAVTVPDSSIPADPSAACVPSQ